MTVKIHTYSHARKGVPRHQIKQFESGLFFEPVFVPIFFSCFFFFLLPFRITMVTNRLIASPTARPIPLSFIYPGFGLVIVFTAAAISISCCHCLTSALISCRLMFQQTECWMNACIFASGSIQKQHSFSLPWIHSFSVRTENSSAKCFQYSTCICRACFHIKHCLAR